MKLKPWLRYFIIIMLIIIVMIWGKYISDDIREKAMKTFDINLYFNNIIMLIIYGGIGVLLGLEIFIKEIRKEGCWAINIPKLILIGMPSLYFSLALIIYSIEHQFSINILYPISVLNNDSTNYMHIFQLIFGYSIITSLYKK